MGYHEGSLRDSQVEDRESHQAGMCYLASFADCSLLTRWIQNLEGDFSLSSEDLQKIDGIDKKLRFNDASASFGWNFFTDLDGKRN